MRPAAIGDLLRYHAKVTFKRYQFVKTMLSYFLGWLLLAMSPLASCYIPSGPTVQINLVRQDTGATFYLQFSFYAPNGATLPATTILSATSFIYDTATGYLFQSLTSLGIAAQANYPSGYLVLATQQTPGLTHNWLRSIDGNAAVSANIQTNTTYGSWFPLTCTPPTVANALAGYSCSTGGCFDSLGYCLSGNGIQTYDSTAFNIASGCGGYAAVGMSAASLNVGVSVASVSAGLSATVANQQAQPYGVCSTRTSSSTTARSTATTTTTTKTTTKAPSVVAQPTATSSNPAVVFPSASALSSGSCSVTVVLHVVTTTVWVAAGATNSMSAIAVTQSNVVDGSTFGCVPQTTTMSS